MTDLRQTPNEQVAPEPSIPASHDSIEFSEGSVIVYDRENPQQWIWADEVVYCTEVQ